jgi:hypothetical protein
MFCPHKRDKWKPRISLPLRPGANVGGDEMMGDIADEVKPDLYLEEYLLFEYTGECESICENICNGEYVFGTESCRDNCQIVND